MKPDAPSWIDLLYHVPPDEKAWPTAGEWAYAIAAVIVLFVVFPWLFFGAGF